MTASTAEEPLPTPTYDRIGRGYRDVRRPDPRLAALIREALGGARSVVNVGAGTGSYEPAGPDVTPVEPAPGHRDHPPPPRDKQAGAAG
ncbi:SAM-dependent methyltransferase, partial [Streptomyces sp. NPDC059082]